jgi:hypothetical protein
VEAAVSARASAIAAVAVLAATGCRKESHKGEPLFEELAPSASASAVPIPAVTWLPPWDEALCPPAPEDEGTASLSDLTLTGTCAFRHVGAAACQARGDDFYITIERKLLGGEPVILHVNVEAYTGSGVYEEKAQVVFMIRRGQALYRWANYWGTMTLGHGSAGMSPARTRAMQSNAGPPTVVEVPPIELTAEPGTPASGTITIRGAIACVLR